MTELTEVPVQSEDAIFDAARYDLPIPKDRYGRKADKLVVSLGTWEPDRTSEDDLEVFGKLEKGTYVDLRLRAFVIETSERSKTSDEGEDETEVKRVLRVHSVEAT